MGTRPEPPSAERLDELAAEYLGITFDTNPDGIVRLAALGLTSAAWRNTTLEDVHASNHPRGGFSDTSMMRFNIATTRVVAKFVRADGVAWSGLRAALTDPERTLPGGLTVGRLMGDELDELVDEAEAILRGAERMEDDFGARYALTYLAMRGTIWCKDWYWSPWWGDTVDAFIELLADPTSSAWDRDDGRSPAPASVADRDRLRDVLRTQPETLDDAAIRWCLRHGFSNAATHRGFARWRIRHDPSWQDPQPWLSE